MSWQHLRCCNSKEWQHACQITLWDKTLADMGLRFILFSLKVFIGTPLPSLTIKGSIPTQKSILLEDSSVNDPWNEDIYCWTYEDFRGLEFSSNFSKIIFLSKIVNVDIFIALKNLKVKYRVTEVRILCLVNKARVLIMFTYVLYWYRPQSNVAG